MRLWELTATDVAQVSAAAATGILPAGAVEHHSPHLPLGTDAIIAEIIAADVESAQPDAVLLMPTLWVGASEHHLAIPGSLSIGTVVTADTLTRQILALASSTGLTRFLIINGHRGNNPPIRVALERIHLSNPMITIIPVDYRTLISDVLGRSSALMPTAKGRGDVVETSILLARRPELVRVERIASDTNPVQLPSSQHATIGIPPRASEGRADHALIASAGYGRICLEAANIGLTELMGALADYNTAGASR